mmetsp:Transcript_5815/g.8979  ORF Transcript_5815/g.8979 Transcript_5815/m.8979 type:complete len:143 (-) Transcript_5815:356-784(-)|eukprot:CAMPEP_0195266490 /NCGR_PEP_ID=MMETSP0706-20130129/12041_1 /TAXON_ID=33640 /ORGANISM="Asterionellopsis glacialis, Strain CCMP134" /LENGTH=142 /DNA_ID=CAMNT_0040321091 /DNA_START=37 /DNA_END=465 /DNA_ORIENTATION=+
MDDYPGGEDPRYGELVRFLTQSQDMRHTAKSAVKQSLFSGGGAFAGAFVMGPIGGLVGGVVGSVVGFLQSDDYDGAVLAIAKLDNDHQQRLMSDVGKVLMTAGATVQQIGSTDAFYSTLSQFAEQEAVRNGVWQACLNASRD